MLLLQKTILSPIVFCMEENKKTYENIAIERAKEGIVTITGAITLAAIDDQKAEELKKIKKEFKLPGFRPGFVPEEILKQHINDGELFREAANECLNNVYPEIIEENKIRPLTYPRVEVVKLTPGEAMQFKIRIGVTPDFKLPNYKTIAKSVPATSDPATEEEVEKVIKEIETARSTETEKFTITEETVSQVGKFETVADFKTKLKEHLQEEKNQNIKMKRREEIGKLLLEKTKIDLPALWEEDTRHEAIHEIEHHAEDHHTTKAEILEKLGKTEEELIKEEIELRAKQEKIKMIIEKIAAEEKLTVEAEEIEREAMNMQAYYREADYERLRQYASEALLREKAIEFLEKA